MDMAAGRGRLIVLKEVFDKVGIFSWLVYGTCLGAYRDSGLIPWDSDIDMGVFPQEEERYQLLIKELEKMVGRVEAWRLEKDPKQRVWLFRVCQGADPYIDIYVYYYNVDGYWFLYPVDGEEDGIIKGRRTPREYFDSFDILEIYGKKFSIPNNVEGYLEYMYGTDWRTPSGKSACEPTEIFEDLR